MNTSTRQIRLRCPDSSATLNLYRMTVSEGLSVPFEYRLEIFSPDHDIELAEMVAKKMIVEVDAASGDTRYFAGHVAAFRHLGITKELSRDNRDMSIYEATVRPWLWFLTQHWDCRIYQNVPVDDIVLDVCKRHGFSDVKKSLSRGYEPLEFCVQYRESDFDFISRLMEQQGIYYFFTHTRNGYEMVLADGYSSHTTAPGCNGIPYYPHRPDTPRTEDHVDHWTVERIVSPRSAAFKYFDYKDPGSQNLHTRSGKETHLIKEDEVFDYPVNSISESDPDLFVRSTLESLTAQTEVAQASGNVRMVYAGALMKLTNHARRSWNKEYLVLSTSFRLVNDEFQTGHGMAAVDAVTSTFSAIDSSTQFRAPRVTPKPVIKGPQTAIVTGKSGEEIWTNKDGCVRLKFHWDRHGPEDEGSSCWVRVSQSWASGKWGSLFLPRIGDEVIVDFLEGDPDHPIVTGRVYNGDKQPPVTLPGDKEMSTIKSRSSKKGGAQNFNEIRLEDKKGSEKFYMHAEKDMVVKVENDRTTTVTNNDDLTVEKGDYSNTVEKGNYIETVKQGDYKIEISMGDHMTKVTLGKCVIEAQSEVLLKCGPSTSVKLTPMGVEIKGTNVKVNGMAMLDLSASGLTTIKGGLVSIN